MRAGGFRASTAGGSGGGAGGGGAAKVGWHDDITRFCARGCERRVARRRNARVQLFFI